MQSAPWTAPTWLPVFQGLLNVKHGEGTRERGKLLLRGGPVVEEEGLRCFYFDSVISRTQDGILVHKRWH